MNQEVGRRWVGIKMSWWSNYFEQHISNNECTFYGYLPLRNGTRALTPRSGNVEFSGQKWKAINSQHLVDFPAIELFAIAYTSWIDQRKFLQMDKLSCIQNCEAYAYRSKLKRVTIVPTSRNGVKSG